MFRLLKGENPLESSSIVIFLILNFIVILSSCIIFSWLWEHLYYKGDPFFIYSVLRNISQFKGFYEGPTAGNYLASHTSFTLLFLAPLAGIFKTPAILGYLNIFIYFISSILIFFISIEYKLSNILSFFFASIFFLIVFSSNGILTSYHYQIDYLAMPLILSMFLSAKRKNIKFLYLSIALFILTKEEYIVWTFILLPLLLYLINFKFKNLSKRTILPISFFSILSYFSLSTLFYFKKMNTLTIFGFNWSDPKFVLSFPKLGQMLDLIITFRKGFIIWILISVFLILLTNKKQKIFSLSLFLYGFIFLFLRLYANQIIYSEFNHLQSVVVGQTWATYSLLIPIFYFILIAQFGIIYQKNKLFLDSKLIIFSLTSLYSIIVLLTFNLSIKEISKHAKNNLYGNYTELSLLKKHIPAIQNKHEYFLSEKNLMAPFMERSHVQIENYFFLKHNRQEFTRIANNAKFAVINCNSLPIIEFLKKLNWVEINECSSNYKLLIPDR